MTESNLSETPFISRAFELLRFAGIHQRHTDAIERVTGAKFNIFKILRVGHLEVTTHSPILGALLDPQGSHGQGPIFLELFIKRFRIKGANLEEQINLDKVRVEIERHIGPVTETSGGRIDILVSDDSGPQFMIENKIYANDQPNQLKRYRNFSKQASLFYLTLTGDSPVGLPREDLDEINVTSISYGDAVLDWLRDCRKEVACIPVVREMISQYISLIEELTHQSANRNMHEELIKEATSSEESLKAFLLLSSLRNAVVDEIVKNLEKPIAEFSERLGLQRTGRFEGLGSNGSGFGFSSQEMSSMGIDITFEFESNKLFFGFRNLDPQIPNPFKTELFNAFANRFSCQNLPNQWWSAWVWFDFPYRNWNDEAYVGIHSGDFVSRVEEIVLMLLEIVKELTLARSE